jgi:hypothetical protein
VNTLAGIAALVAVLSTAIIYGTDLFCALVLRPAASRASDASVADLIGWIHEYGDRRLPIPGVLSIIATALATALHDSVPARIGGSVALAALLLWLVVYLRISAPINRELRAAAAGHTVPPGVRRLQQRWDSVIWPRAALQTIALAGLLTLLLNH